MYIRDSKPCPCTYRHRKLYMTCHYTHNHGCRCNQIYHDSSLGSWNPKDTSGITDID